MTQLVVAATVEKVVELTAQGRHEKGRTPSGQHELVAGLSEEIHHRTGGKPPCLLPASARAPCSASAAGRVLFAAYFRR